MRAKGWKSKDEIVKVFAGTTGCDLARAQELWDEYCVFFVAKMMTFDYDGDLISAHEIVDEMWHSHVLCSELYEAFCKHMIPPPRGG